MPMNRYSQLHTHKHHNGHLVGKFSTQYL